LISNIVDFEMDLARATAAPRLHHQHLPDVLYFERDGLNPDVVSALKSIGHTIQERSGYQGDTQSIMILPDGSFIGMADPRRGGAAVGVRRATDVVQ